MSAAERLDRSIAADRASRGIPTVTPLETEFQAQVIELAHTLGWRHLHVRRSIGKGRKWVTTTNLVGWPDLMLMRPPDGLVFAELKVGRNTTTPAQDELLAYLDLYPFAEARVWTPDDWDDITATLSRRPKGS